MERELAFCYGSRKIQIRIPEKNIGSFIEPKKLIGAVSLDVVMKRANIGRKLNGKKVAIMIEDCTRDEPHNEIIHAICSALGACVHAQFIITTGTHESNNKGNRQIAKMIIGACEEKRIGDFDVHIHDCEKDEFMHNGRTSRGTFVESNTVCKDCDVFLIGADMKPHYFAGYSNAVKNFLPGICSFETVRQNHALAMFPESCFGTHPFHPDEGRRKNPVAEDMVEAMGLIASDRPKYALALISSREGNKYSISWAKAGEIQKITREGIREVDRRMCFLAKPSKYVIISPGNSPEDETVYVWQRCLELCSKCISDGAEILVIAESGKKEEQGIGPARTLDVFYNILRRPIDEIIKMGEKLDEYLMYMHKPVKFALLRKRVKNIFLYSSLPDRIVEEIHMTPVSEPQEVVDHWLKNDQNAKILCINAGNKVALYPK
ncbi:MAG: lactate racemase domain-containing protein [Candidatus Micrarchaeia archaeon]